MSTSQAPAAAQGLLQGNVRADELWRQIAAEDPDFAPIAAMPHAERIKTFVAMILETRAEQHKLKEQLSTLTQSVQLLRGKMEEELFGSTLNIQKSSLKSWQK